MVSSLHELLVFGDSRPCTLRGCTQCLHRHQGRKKRGQGGREGEVGRGREGEGVGEVGRGGGGRGEGGREGEGREGVTLLFDNA